MTLRKWLAALGAFGAVVGLCALLAMPHGAEARGFRSYLMYAGTPDSSSVRTAWVPIRGAQRVVIRMWSQHAAFAITGADTALADSLQEFTMFVSDSICCFVTGPGGNTIASAADSFSVTQGTAQDTTTKMVGFYPSPVNKQLRSAANGGGIHVVVFPRMMIGAQMDQRGAFADALMRVTFTPLRRSVGNAGTSITSRVNGLRSFKMVADVYED